MLNYERWEVFQDLVELRDIAARLATKYPRRGLGTELTQLVRSSSSAVLNLGEGAKHTKKGHKLERYGATLASIGECNANLVILASQLPRDPLIARGQFLCSKTSRMMTNLIRTVERDWE